jgi:hypothetical protein
MDPITHLQLSAQRRTEFERRANEQRLARAIRPARSWAMPSRRPRPAAVSAPSSIACCPA